MSDTVYYGNRKQTGSAHLFNFRNPDDFMTSGIRGKSGQWNDEPEFDAAAYAKTVAHDAATGKWMKNIQTNDKATRKAAGPMKQLAENGLSFEEIDSIMKRTGQKVLDSDNDVAKVMKEYNRMHNIGKDGGGDKKKDDYKPPKTTKEQQEKYDRIEGQIAAVDQSRADAQERSSKPLDRYGDYGDYSSYSDKKGYDMRDDMRDPDKDDESRHFLDRFKRNVIQNTRDSATSA